MGLSRQEYWSGLSFPPPGETFWLRNRTWVSCISRWILYHWATREAPCSGTHSVVLNPLPPLLTIYFIFSMTVYSLNSSPSYFWDAVLEYCLFSEGVDKTHLEDRWNAGSWAQPHEIWFSTEMRVFLLSSQVNSMLGISGPYLRSALLEEIVMITDLDSLLYNECTLLISVLGLWYHWDWFLVVHDADIKSVTWCEHYRHIHSSFHLLVLFATQGSYQGLPYSSVGKESACSTGDPSLIPRSGRSAGEGIGYPLQYSWASLVAQLVKNLPAMQETWVWSWVRKIPWRRERIPIPVFWPGEFHRLYSPRGHIVSHGDTTERLSLLAKQMWLDLKEDVLRWSKRIQND